MALFGSKKDQELEKLKNEKASVEESLQNKIAELEQELKKRDETIAASSAVLEEELEKLKQAHIDEIVAVRKENAIQMQQMLEFVDARKEELEKKSDRELLLSVVMALDGYAGRLERVERNMEYHDVIERMTEMKKEFNENLDNTQSALLEKLEGKEVFGKIGELQENTINRLYQMQNAFSSMIDTNTKNLNGKITFMNETLTELMNSLKLPEKLEALSGQIDDLYSKLSDKVDELERTVAEKLDDYDIAAGMDSLQEILNGVDSTADGIEESVDKILEWLNDSGLMYDSYELKNALSALDDMKSNIDNLEEIKNAVNEIKGSVCDSWSSDSISSKLDSLESSIRDIGYNVDAAKDAAERAANHDSY